MAGLVPAIHVFAAKKQDVDARDKRGHDEQRGYAAFFLATGSSSTPMMSDSFMIRRSLPSILTSVPDHLPNSTRSPTFRSMGMSLPASSRPPGPTAVISPWEGFSLAVSGMMIPPAGFSSASMRLTTTQLGS